MQGSIEAAERNRANGEMRRGRDGGEPSAGETEQQAAPRSAVVLTPSPALPLQAPLL